MKLFSEIIIEVMPDRFLFTWDTDHIEMETIINFEPNTYKLLSTGKPIGTNNGVSVNLFSNNPPFKIDVDKAELLNTFMQTVIGKLAAKKRFLILRPIVIYKGDESLSSILCGYQRALLTAAAIAGGARAAKFE
ncbi:MAG: hypothetical protein C4583_05450 [Anaerolineaceae bacterium]|nr:MAG: hypothetical protein C4583_05450 [Anaerolineaceae bacterium]